MSFAINKTDMYPNHSESDNPSIVRHVSVVILNYNRRQDLVQCVESLKRTTYPRVTISVVDNSSQDGSAQSIAKIFPDVCIHRLDRNLGYAGGMNHGIFEALRTQRPDYIFALNSDTLVEKDTISLLVEAMEQNVHAALATGTLRYFQDPSRIYYAGGRAVPSRASCYTIYDAPVNGEIRKVTFVTGCAFLLRASVIQGEGLFDERFFMYLEDAALSVQLTRRGFDLLYVPNATVLHKVEHDGERPVPLYFAVRNRQLFLRDYVRGPAKLAGFVYLYLTLLVKIVVWSFSKPELVRAILLAIQDYRAKRFFQGRAFSLLVK